MVGQPNSGGEGGELPYTPICNINPFANLLLNLAKSSKLIMYYLNIFEFRKYLWKKIGYKSFMYNCLGNTG